MILKKTVTYLMRFLISPIARVCYRSNIKVILHLELTKGSLKTQYNKYSVSDALQNTFQTAFVLLINMNVQCIRPNTESYHIYMI